MWKGGGTIFGPQPRDYSINLPENIKRVARKSALSLKVRESQLKIVEDFSFEVPKTRQMVDVLKALHLAGKKVLFLTDKSDEKIHQSGRNIPKVKILEAYKASTYEILNYDFLLVQKSAISVIENTFGGKK